MTRTGMVLKAARAMYHGQVPPNITEDEAWKDADEFCKLEYIEMALAAYVSISATVPELLTVSSGSCLCREELHRDPTRLGYNQLGLCATCGGGV